MYKRTDSIHLAGAGLAFKGQLINELGAEIGARFIFDHVVDRGSGWYYVTYSGYPAGFRGGVDVRDATSDAILGATSINPEEFEDIQKILAKTNLIGTAGGTVITPPVGADGSTLTLIRGDAYSEAEDREIRFINSDGTWPDLTGGVVKLVFRMPPRTKVARSLTGTIVVPSGAGQELFFEPTAEDTLALPGGRGAGLIYDYQVEATLGSDHVTLKKGRAYVIQP